MLPIAQHHGDDAPFLGAIVAGEFPAPSLNQMRSVGFRVVHIPYAEIVAAFDRVNVDIRDERTPDSAYSAALASIRALTNGDSLALRRAPNQGHVPFGTSWTSWR